MAAAAPSIAFSTPAASFCPSQRRDRSSVWSSSSVVAMPFHHRSVRAKGAMCVRAEEFTLLQRSHANKPSFQVNQTMFRSSGVPLLSLKWLLLFCACALQWRAALASESSELPVLKVGEERRRERLVFFDGESCEYELQGLQNGKWYEIKISYPASIPASLDIVFLQHRSHSSRKLLNIEKTMFYVDGTLPQQDLGPLGRVLVTVHPAGVISRHHSSDHEFIIYNILCEEVFLGIPKQAYWVGCLAVLVIYSAFYISGRLPASLVPAKPRVHGKNPREAN